MSKSTTQAIKVSATWTPNSMQGKKMADAIFGEGAAAGVRFEGGRIGIKHAIAIDLANPSLTARASERVAVIKSELESMGTVHTFHAVAGAAPVNEVETLEEQLAPSEEPVIEGDAA